MPGDSRLQCLVLCCIVHGHVCADETSALSLAQCPFTLRHKHVSAHTFVQVCVCVCVFTHIRGYKVISAYVCVHMSAVNDVRLAAEVSQGGIYHNPS